MSRYALLLLLPLITFAVGHIDAAPAPQAAVVFVDFGGQQWSAADRSEALIGVQRGIDLWGTGPAPLDLVAYDAGVVRVGHWDDLHDLERSESLTIYVAETRPGRFPLADKRDSYTFKGRDFIIITTDNRWPSQFATQADFTAAMVGHEVGHAVHRLSHALPPDCRDDVMGWPRNALYAWYIGECSRLALEAR